MITKYVDALVAHAPPSLPLAENVRFTEDSRQLSLGEGAWKTVTRAGSFRQDYLDVRRGIAASHVILHPNIVASVAAVDEEAGRSAR